MEDTPNKKRKPGSSPSVHRPFKSPFCSTPGRRSPPATSSPLPLAKSDAVAVASPTPAHGHSATSGMKIPDLRRRHAELIRETRMARSELDTIQQAIAIEDSDKDTGLKRLIDLWKTASQSAAEDMFAFVREKINDMGGVVAWRKQQRARQELQEGWAKPDAEDESSEKDSTGEDDDLSAFPECAADLTMSSSLKERCRRRGLRAIKLEARIAAHNERPTAEAEVAALKDTSQPAAPSQVDILENKGFTMDMMLQELKIDLGAIGFDTERQQWGT